MSKSCQTGSHRNISFVDGGGYTGDTSRRLIQKYPDFKKIYFIEPIEQNIKVARRELHQYKNIEFLRLGLSNKKGILDFNDEKSFSTFHNKHGEKVEIDRIDNIIDGRVDYIKFDIEGAEQDAIEGARYNIKKYKPILAICIYHKAEDWYMVPKKVFEINPDYNIYIRHYMEGVFETVMYFVPK